MTRYPANFAKGKKPNFYKEKHRLKTQENLLGKN